MPDLNPYRIYIQIAAAILGAVAIAAASWWVTKTYYQLQIADMVKLQQAQIIIAQDRAAHQQADQDKITQEIASAAAAARQAQLQAEIARLRQVGQYVSPETDARFPLPCGALRVYNSGLTASDPSTIPLPAGATDASKCDVPASAAFSIIRQNTVLGLGWKAEVDEWWDWYNRQKAKWDEYLAKVAKPAPAS